jgi:hypothetical protein
MDGADGTSDALEPPLPQPARDLLDAVYVRSGRAASARVAGDALAAFPDSPFAPPQRESFLRQLELTADEVLDLYCTVSSIASLSDPERAELRRQLRPMLSGPYRLPLTTELYWARLR